MTKIIRADGCYVPRNCLAKSAILERADKTFYFNTAQCAKCDRLESRPNDCEGCENFLGRYKLWSLHHDKQYVRLPRDMFFRLNDYFGVDVDDFTVVDKRKSPPMPHFELLKFRFSLLREEQRRTLAQMYKWKEQGIRGIIKAAPRTGKTVMSLALMCKLGFRAAWIAPQEDLLRGFRADAEKFTNLLDVERTVGRILIGTPRDCEEAQQMCVSLLTPHTFISEKGWAKLDDFRLIYGTVGLDECHRMNANVFSKVIDQFYARNVFGVTATDKRKDKKEAICAEIVGPVIAESTAESLTPTVYVHDVEFKSKTRKDAKIFLYYRELFANKSYVSYATDLILRLVADGHKVVVPVVNKSHIVKLYARLNKKLRVGVFAGSSHPGYAGADLNRERVLSRAQAGKLDVVIGIRAIIATGINVIPWSALVVLCPTKNEHNMYQETKRVCTPGENKLDPELHFLVETSARGLESVVHQYTHCMKKHKYNIDPKSKSLILQWQDQLNTKSDNISDEMFGTSVVGEDWYEEVSDSNEDDVPVKQAVGLAKEDSFLNGSF